MRLCREYRKPRFEIMNWPAEELEWQSAYFSIVDSNDKPLKSEIIKKRSETMTVNESKSSFKALMW